MGDHNGRKKKKKNLEKMALVRRVFSLSIGVAIQHSRSWQELCPLLVEMGKPIVAVGGQSTFGSDLDAFAGRLEMADWLSIEAKIAELGPTQWE